MSLFYVIEIYSGPEICSSPKDAREMILKHPRSSCRVFINKETAIEYSVSVKKSVIPERPIKKSIDYQSIPIRGHPVAYICYIQHKNNHYYAVTYKLPSHNWKTFTGKLNEVDKGLEQVTSIAVAIERLLEEILYKEITIYVNDQRFCIMYNKSLPLWKSNDWIVKHPPIEFKVIKSFYERTFKSKFIISQPLNSSMAYFEKLNKAISES